MPKADIVIVAVKTTSISKLKELVTPSLKKDSKILIIQNGIGNEEYISALFPNHTIISCISAAAATRREKALTEVFTISEMRLALFNSQDKSLLDDIKGLFTFDIKPKFVIFESHKEMRWKKLLWNTTFCALSIIYQKPTDVIASQKPYANIVLRIMQEVQKIALSEGVNIRSDDIEQTIQVSCGMTDYYASTYWDYVAKNPIEKEYLIENVLNIGRKNNIDTPLLELMVSNLDCVVKHN